MSEQKRLKPEFVGTAELPWSEGTHRGNDVSDDLDTALREGRWTLTGLAQDHVFYSAALLQMSGVVADPVSIYWAENNLDLKESPLCLQVDKCLFQGLPVPIDRMVFACPKHLAAGLLRFLDRFAVGDPYQGNYWESVHQIRSLVDWKLVGNMTVVPDRPPSVDIHMYGMMNREKMLLWRNPKDPWKEAIWLGELPRPKKRKTEESNNRRSNPRFGPAR